MSADETSLEDVVILLELVLSKHSELINDDSCEDLHCDQHDREEGDVVEQEPNVIVGWQVE